MIKLDKIFDEMLKEGYRYPTIEFEVDGRGIYRDILHSVDVDKTDIPETTYVVVSYPMLKGGRYAKCYSIDTDGLSDERKEELIIKAMHKAIKNMSFLPEGEATTPEPFIEK